MALYHVSLVKGKKNDGTRIKAVERVKTSTVRRSKYADADKEPDNLIRVPKGSPLLLDGTAVYLYKSGFGDILNPPEGLRISGDASPRDGRHRDDDREGFLRGRRDARGEPALQG